MTDKLIVSIGGWVTIQAEGLLAVSVLTIIVFSGALAFTVWVRTTDRNS